MIQVIALMRDWLINAGSDELFDDYCGYVSSEVLNAIEDMYPEGVLGWMRDANIHLYGAM